VFWAVWVFVVLSILIETTFSRSQNHCTVVTILVMHNHIFLYIRFSTKSVICTHLPEDLIRFVEKSRVTRIVVIGILQLLTRSTREHTNKISLNLSHHHSITVPELEN
jgi:hypothetical protein